MTYGDEQEAACSALLSVLRADPPRREIPLLLACRRQSQLAVGDRIGALRIRRRLELPQRARQTLDATKYPVELLADVHRTMPRPDVPDLAPTDILIGPTAEAAVAGWQAVARHLTLANADLRRWADDPYRTDNRRWHLIADLATVVEALVVADQQLAEAGHLAPRGRDDYIESRLAVANVARVTSWRDIDPSPDHAVPDAPTVTTARGGMVSLITRSEDYPFAQRHLARLLRPVAPSDWAYNDVERHGLRAARAVASGQIRLATVFGEWADRASAPLLAARFRERIDAYAAFDCAMKRLAERNPMPSPYVVTQQSEMVRQLRKHREQQPTPSTLTALDAATHEVAVNVGLSLRRETMARRNIQIFDENERTLRPITSSRERFYVACRRLAEEPAIEPEMLIASRHHRDDLAAALAQRSSAPRRGHRLSQMPAAR
ncbi:hypothetical protein SAMN04487968_11732 [Nocardioides terrae]|uniref:Uncharacterized protein n=1 Tax=Nocardioides terrae TaxID=574651 RepID=A0A1I1NHK3_9ACTN|nr:hypothetical protein [Nocardioides terrae]SFC97184.1 hypothetical protein SAMN04487968_11732 [Nocardioides terrae]